MKAYNILTGEWTAIDDEDIEKRKLWLTPPELLEQLREEFGDFDIDPCPYPKPDWDGLTIEWSDPCFVNPPFKTVDGGPITRWMEKGVEEWRKGKTIIFLLPCMGYWRALPNIVSETVEIRWLKRIKYLDVETKKPAGSPPHDSCLIILRKGRQKTLEMFW